MFFWRAGCNESRKSGSGRDCSYLLGIFSKLRFGVKNKIITIYFHTQCVRACPCDVLEMVSWDGCKAGQIASAPRTEDCIGCKRCETACPTDFLSVRVYLGGETTRSLGLAY